MNIQEIRTKLQVPLPPESIKPHPSKPYLSTIKAIYVTERLNDVFGLNGWQTQTEMLNWFEKTTPKGKIEYTAVLKTTITVPEYGIRHECIASSTNEDLGDAAKGATTDAITKIGSYLEIGIDVFKGLKSPTPAKTPKPTEKVLPELKEGSKDFDYCLKRIKEGVTLETIKKNFRISPEIEAKLK